MSSSSASNLVREFLLLHCDDAAADYAASLVESDDDADAISALREFLIEACGEGNEGDIDDLLRQCREHSAGRVGTSPPPPPSSAAAPDKLGTALELSPSALLRALELRNTKVEEAELLADDEIGVGGGGRRKESGGDESGDDEGATAATDQGSISSLLELFPGRGRDYLSYALGINSGDVSEAASWLSSSSNEGNDNGESSWRSAREERRARRKAERAADEAAKAKLLQKFDATAVVTSGEGTGNARAPIRLWGDDFCKKKSSSSKQPQQRYLDGVPVNSKQKYIVVQDKEDWDGGSRGRVILKGKRGKGGVSLAK